MPFFFGQDVTVFQADVIFLVEEALFLHAGHVQDVQVGHGILQAAGLLVGDAVGLQHVLDDIIGYSQLFRADEHKADVLEAGHGLDEGVDGATKLQVAAQADGQVVQPAHPAANGHQVGDGLSGVLMAAVAGVDDRDAGITAGAQRGTLLGVAHGDDIGVAGHHTDGVGHALALCLRWRRSHWGSPAHGRPGSAWRPQRRGGCGWMARRTGWQVFVLGDVLVGGRIGADAVGQTQQIHDFFLAEV